MQANPAVLSLDRDLQSGGHADVVLDVDRAPPELEAIPRSGLDRNLRRRDRLGDRGLLQQRLRFFLGAGTGNTGGRDLYLAARRAVNDNRTVGVADLEGAA